MKLLLATGVYPPESGGPATYTKLLEERLPALGFEVTVLPFRSVRHLPKVLRHLAYFWKVLSAKADIIYAQDTVSVGLPSALAAILRRKKFVVRVPGDYAWEQARQRFGVSDELDEFQKKSYGLRVGALRAVQRFVVRRAKRVVVPSEYLKNIVMGWGGRHAQVIYSSIETPHSAEISRPSGFLVVSAGRRVPWKGFEALQRVVEAEKDWNLFIAEKLPRAEALGWIKAADVFVLNSTYEGLSHVLVEAMTLGTPVIATAVGGNPELIEDKKDGLLIAAKNDEALHSALKEVFQNPEAARSRALHAQERAKEFSIDVTIAKIEELLKSV